MYFESKLNIHPDLESHTQRIRPTKFFAKMVVWLSAGLASKKEEIQTYTAVSILQSLNMVLRSVGVDNIVRISKDQLEIYYDLEGEKGDLPKALEQFAQEVDPIESEVFEDLRLVLEHEDEGFKYLIEISILRRHPKGQAPIRITAHGVPGKFRRQPSENASALMERMRQDIPSQEDYDRFQNAAQENFNAFVDSIVLGLRAHLPIKSIDKGTKTKVVRTKRDYKPNSSSGDSIHDHSPIHRSYAGFDDWQLSMWLWSDLCRDHNIHVHNITLVDPTGHNVMDLGSTGFNAGDNDVLNPDTALEIPSGTDNVIYSGHMYSDEVESAGYHVSGVSDEGVEICSDASSSSWSDSDSWSGGSSCSSCSSCGGCGGD